MDDGVMVKKTLANTSPTILTIQVQPPDYLSIADSGLPSYEAAIRLPLSPRILLEASSHTVCLPGETSSIVHLSLCLPGAAPPPHTPDIALDIPTLPTNLPPVYSADSRFLYLTRAVEGLQIELIWQMCFMKIKNT